jgi:hypothetical protein
MQRMLLVLGLVVFTAQERALAFTAGALDNDSEVPSGLGIEAWWDYSGRYTDKSIQSDPFYSYYLAARNRKLPTFFFNEIFSVRINKYVSFSSNVISPRFVYTKSFIGRETGTIYLPSYFSKDPSRWTITEWQGFYNEMFHLWWHFVFMKKDEYRGDRAYLFSNRFLAAYSGVDRINNDRIMVQEEAFSETVSAVLLYFKSVPFQMENKSMDLYYDMEKFDYALNLTVPDSCHDEDPKYDCTNPVYLSVGEYVFLMGLMTQNEDLADYITESQNKKRDYVYYLE